MKSLGVRLRGEALSWSLMRRWAPWLVVTTLRGGWVLFSLAHRQKSPILIAFLVLTWEAGKIAEHLAEPAEDEERKEHPNA